MPRNRSGHLTGPASALVAIALAAVGLAGSTAAQVPDAKGGNPAPAKTSITGTLKRFDGVWVEGPGFDITYGGTYQACSKRCLANAKCVMIEFYRPEKKCNLYDSVRKKLKGGLSVVGVRS
jgi:hypothetical protein